MSDWTRDLRYDLQELLVTMRTVTIEKIERAVELVAVRANEDWI